MKPLNELKQNKGIYKIFIQEERGDFDLSCYTRKSGITMKYHFSLAKKFN